MLLERSAAYISETLDVLIARGTERISLLGGMAPLYVEWLPPHQQALLVKPSADALTGALQLALKRYGSQSGRGMNERKFQRLPAEKPAGFNSFERRRTALHATASVVGSRDPRRATGRWRSPAPERDIAEYANISRVTVRKAVDDLVKAGLLVRRHGSGTFVVRPAEKVQQSLSMLTSFTEDMARRGVATQSKWLERGLYYPSPEEMMKLGVSSEMRVARLGRLRMAGELPLAIERASLSVKSCPIPMRSGVALCRTRSGGFSARARRAAYIRLQYQGADAHILGVTEGDAGLSIERISYLPSGRVVEFTKSLYRGDAYDFVAELTIPHP